MEAGCEKNLRFSSRSPRTSNFFPKSLQSAHRFRIWLFLDPGTKKELHLIFANTYSVRKHHFFRDPTNSERRFAPVLCLRLRRTVRKSWASVETPRIFCISCFYAGYAKKGACLARMAGKRMFYGWQNPSLHLFRFGCHEGELRPGSFG